MSTFAPVYSIIIPAHNEEARIGATLEDFAQVFSDAEIVVVLNGCKDRSAERAFVAQARWPNIGIINIEDSVGKGGAVRAGFFAARSPIIAYADADGATPAVELRRLCARLSEDDGAAAVIGSRWLPESVIEVRQPVTRRVASRIFNGIVRLLFSLPFRDTQCGAKAFRKDALVEVLPHVETSNLAFDVDLLYLLFRNKKKVVELPTVWRDVLGSRVNLVSASLLMLGAMLRLRLRHSFLRTIVPIFDRLFPTQPMRAHDQFSILILNWRDIKHPQAGGAEAYLHEQAKRWVAGGHHVEWLTAGFAGAPPRDRIDGVAVTRVGNALTVYALLPLQYLKGCRDRFDIIIDSENGIPFFSPLFSLRPKICLMYHVHKDVFLSQLRAPFSWLLVAIESWIMPLVYRHVAFVAISQDTRTAMLQQRLTKKPVRVVQSGVSADLCPGAKSALPSIAYVGRLRPYKRLDLLISAMPQVLRQVPDATLTIAGRGDDEARLRILAATLHVERAVHFEGFVDEDKKRELLQRAWLFVAPSLMEGWGISVIEANACATPAVAFAVPGLREAIRDGRSGVLVPEGDSLAPAVIDLLTDHERRRRLSQGATERAQEFSWDVTAASMLEILQDQAICNPHALIRSQSEWKLVTRTPEGLRESMLTPSQKG